MDFIVKPITRKLKDYKEICDLMKASFPKDELISLSFWRMLTLRKNIKFSAFYEKDKLIGVLYTVEYKNYVYIPFLAICEKERNKGYGGHILKWIKEKFSKIIVLHIEPLDLKATNYNQRLRRASFYNKNGINDTQYRFKFLGVHFAVYSSDTERFDISIHKKLMEWFAFHIVRFKFKKED